MTNGSFSDHSESNQIQNRKGEVHPTSVCTGIFLASFIAPLKSRKLIKMVRAKVWSTKVIGFISFFSPRIGHLIQCASVTYKRPSIFKAPFGLRNWSVHGAEAQRMFCRMPSTPHHQHHGLVFFCISLRRECTVCFLHKAECIISSCRMTEEGRFVWCNLHRHAQAYHFYLHLLFFSSYFFISLMSLFVVFLCGCHLAVVALFCLRRRHSPLHLPATQGRGAAAGPQ